ncbi:MAG: selenide, water dikinase SelD [Paracoccaceae bacterium]
MQMPLPQTRDVVLVGGGHTHALVLRMFGMRPVPGARLTVINPGPTAPYSGMLPGFVAGHYGRDALDIDLVQLARFAGARVIQGAAHHIDVAAQQVHVNGRPPIAYDYCSVDVGITSAMPDLPGFADHGVPAKPLGPFSERWASYLSGTGPAKIAVLGGGVAGVELVLAMAHALRSAGRSAKLHLVDRAQALTAVDAVSQARLRAALSDYDVNLVENAEVARVAADGIHLGDNTLIETDFVTGAAGALPHDWIADSDLALQDGFITVNAQLLSSDQRVFAVGDCAHLGFDPRPKAGVYAVRQAPVLRDNLVAVLSGRPLRAYKPQKDYLKLISLGGKSALAQRLGRSFSGPLMWRWKDHIDQKFMAQFRELPAMGAPDLPPLRALGVDEALGDKPLCGGCGSKVGRSLLRASLGTPSVGRDDIETLPGDDAALLRVGGARQVITTDHLRAFTLDPVLMTRITVTHALGDIWAMGARPQATTLSLILPRLSPELQGRTLAEINTVARETLHAAGAEIVGGHTTMGAELTIGLTVTGLCEAEPVTLAGGQPGDVLILTKPVGSGVILAAEMAGNAPGAVVTGAFEQMLQGQGEASAILAPAAHAMTDVTGFGLAGHLHGMCEASDVGASLNLDAVPLMEGALKLAEQDVRSTLYADNRSLTPDLPEGGVADLLYDPQTSGGLLAAVPADAAADLLEQLQAAGYPAARIGVLTEAPVQITLD